MSLCVAVMTIVVPWISVSPMCVLCSCDEYSSPCIPVSPVCVAVMTIVVPWIPVSPMCVAVMNIVVPVYL